MRINGQRRIRSGHAGSHHKQEMPVEQPPPPKKGKGVHWRDYDAHHERGHSSFMDLELSSTPSRLEKGEDERIVLAEELWYKGHDFEEERKIVKAEFFRRLGEADADAEAEHSWNRLTAYSGQPYGELFDFQEDPNEFRNLWDEPDYRSLRDELRIELLDKIMETGSPLPRQFSRS